MMKTNEREGDAVYVLRHSEGEHQRLIEQQGFLGGSTERLFVDAGIGPGMRVLDVGSGVGEVSLLAASLVGPGARWWAWTQTRSPSSVPGNVFPRSVSRT